MIVEIAEYRFNMKNIIQLFSIVLTAAALPMITGCDSGGGSGANISSLPSRFDLADLQANPGDIATFPSNLIATDRIEYDAISQANFNLQGPDQISSDGQAPGVLVPSSAGVIQINRQSYLYNRTAPQTAIINLSPLEVPNAAQFDADLQEIVNSSLNSSSGLASILSTTNAPVSVTTFTFSLQGQQFLEDAIESIGYAAENFPGVTSVGAGGQTNNGILTVQGDLNNVVILRSRTLTHTITSTNADILASGEIRGTYNLQDSYFDLALQATVGDSAYTVIIARNPTFTGVLQQQFIRPFTIGTFTLQLGDLEDINPNP